MNKLGDMIKYIHAIGISFYFAGIIFIGSNFLLFEKSDLLNSADIKSIIFAVITFVVYLSTLLVMSKFKNRFKLYETGRMVIPIITLVSSFGLGLILLPNQLIQDFIMNENSQKYYFYMIDYLGLTSALLFVYHILWINKQPSTTNPNNLREYIKEELKFYLELLRGGVILLAAALFSVVYTQSLEGAISGSEMILIMFTIVGYIMLFLMPLYFIYNKKLHNLL